MAVTLPPAADASRDFFDEPRQLPWPRLFNRLTARRDRLATAILAGGLDLLEYREQAGRYSEIQQTIEDMQGIIRGEDLPRRTELPEA